MNSHTPELNFEVAIQELYSSSYLRERTTVSFVKELAEWKKRHSVLSKISTITAYLDLFCC